MTFSNIDILYEYPVSSSYLSVIIISDGSCWSISKDNLVQVYPNWGDLFKIDFRITVTKLPQETWTNVFHFSADGDHVNYGDRIPGFWIYNRETTNSPNLQNPRPLRIQSPRPLKIPIISKRSGTLKNANIQSPRPLGILR